jgi:hypothetical protein
MELTKSKRIKEFLRSPQFEPFSFLPKQVIVSFSGQLTYSRISRHSGTIMAIAQ